jgi:putative toxin-antitoxin system antitoxin component (TIGR02293 family)
MRFACPTDHSWQAVRLPYNVRLLTSPNWYIKLCQLNMKDAMKTATVEKKTASAKAKHPTDLIRQIQKGLRFTELETLQNSIGLPFDQLAAKLCISRSTLQRRKAAGRLSPDESDRVVRYSRLLKHATRVFGDIDRARAWLKHPQFGLGGAVPLDYASTEAGAREVENLLGRIEYSVYS